MFLCALLLSLTACGPKYEEMSTTIFAMDTVMNLKLYHAVDAGAVEVMFNDGVESIYDYERLFSATAEGSDVHNINAGGGEITPVSEVTADVLRQAVALSQRTGGALDITAYPAVKAWGFTTGEYRVPSGAELTELAGRIDYTRVELEGETACIPAGMQLDLGAVAKGYVGDRLAEEMKGYPALLDLGQSTIVAIGSKPDGSAWRIGIQDPDSSDYLGVLELSDQAMGSSGNYQRWFEENGVRYGHIIDPDTAAPADSGLSSVTVVADSALLCDGLSTALFVMGLEEAADHWRQYRDFEAIFIENGGEITVTAGLKERFSLTDAYRNQEVSVLE